MPTSVNACAGVTACSRVLSQGLGSPVYAQASHYIDAESCSLFCLVFSFCYDRIILGTAERGAQYQCFCVTWQLVLLFQVW